MLDAPDIAVDREVQERLQALADFSRKQKVKVDERARPAIDPREAYRVYFQLLRSATSDRQTDEEFGRNASWPARCRPTTRATARERRGPPLSHRDWLAFSETRHRMRRQWAEFFRATTCSCARRPPPRRSRTITRASATSARCRSTASACR